MHKIFTTRSTKTLAAGIGTDHSARTPLPAIASLSRSDYRRIVAEMLG